MRRKFKKRLLTAWIMLSIYYNDNQLTLYKLNDTINLFNFIDIFILFNWRQWYGKSLDSTWLYPTPWLSGCTGLIHTRGPFPMIIHFSGEILSPLIYLCSEMCNFVLKFPDFVWLIHLCCQVSLCHLLLVLKSNKAGLDLFQRLCMAVLFCCKAATESFRRDTAKLWNNAPIPIINVTSFSNISYCINCE